MFTNLEVFQTSHAMARHAGARQALTAANLANADTPGYRARHMAPFADVHGTDKNVYLQATREGHLSTGPAGGIARTQDAAVETAPNGNSVSLELEMINAVEIQREHSRALAIYKHSLDVLRTSIGRR